MQMSYRTRLGYRSYPLARDRWACSVFRYPWFVPRSMTFDYWGADGTAWGFMNLLSPISGDVVVDAAREQVTFTWWPITPDFLFSLRMVWGSGPIGDVVKYTRPTIQFFKFSFPGGPFDYTSTVDARDGEHANWLVSRSEWYTTVGGQPACPYDFHPTWWDDYPIPFDQAYYGPGHVVVP